MRIARDGIPFVLGGAALTVALWVLGWAPLALLALLLTVFIGWFFRDPEREVTRDPGAVLAPGDGRVVAVREEGHATLVSIFLSLFDVHVNRSPIGGVVQDVTHKPGRFGAAFREEASRRNEQTRVRINGDRGTVVLVQVAGLVARRIVCRIEAGQTVAAGQRIGLIRFGSRVDLLIPPSWSPTVREGDRVRGGLTVVARTDSGGGR